MAALGPPPSSRTVKAAAARRSAPARRRLERGAGSCERCSCPETSTPIAPEVVNCAALWISARAPAARRPNSPSQEASRRATGCACSQVDRPLREARAAGGLESGRRRRDRPSTVAPSPRECAAIAWRRPREAPVTITTVPAFDVEAFMYGPVFGVALRARGARLRAASRGEHEQAAERAVHPARMALLVQRAQHLAANAA